MLLVRIIRLGPHRARNRKKYISNLFSIILDPAFSWRNEPDSNFDLILSYDVVFVLVKEKSLKKTNNISNCNLFVLISMK